MAPLLLPYMWRRPPDGRRALSSLCRVRAPGPCCSQGIKLELLPASTRLERQSRAPSHHFHHLTRPLLLSHRALATRTGSRQKRSRSPPPLDWWEEDPKLSGDWDTQEARPQARERDPERRPHTPPDHPSAYPPSLLARKRKIAFLVCFIGTKYNGLQHHENHPHSQGVELPLLEALYLAGLVSPANYLSASRIGWSRSSRTDKGVHASGLVISAKLLLEPPFQLEFDSVLSARIAARVNEHLPADIRVLGFQRPVNGFSARTTCSLRTYKYVVPEYFVDGLDDNDWVSQSEGDGDDAGASGVVGDEEHVAVDDVNDGEAVGDDVAAVDEVNGADVGVNAESGDGDGGGEHDNVLLCPQARQARHEAEMEARDERRDAWAKTLQSLIGVKCVHNFVAGTFKTSGRTGYLPDNVFSEAETQGEASRSETCLTSYIDPSPTSPLACKRVFEAQRYHAEGKALHRTIEVFRVERVTLHGVKCLQFHIWANAFGRHQVRKMIGLVLGVARGALPLDTAELACGPWNLRTPLAPGRYLFLQYSGVAFPSQTPEAGVGPSRIVSPFLTSTERFAPLLSLSSADQAALAAFENQITSHILQVPQAEHEATMREFLMVGGELDRARHSLRDVDVLRERHAVYCAWRSHQWERMRLKKFGELKRKSETQPTDRKTWNDRAGRQRKPWNGQQGRNQHRGARNGRQRNNEPDWYDIGQ